MTKQTLEERPRGSSDGPPCCCLAGKGLSMDWGVRPKYNNGGLRYTPTDSTCPGLGLLLISCPPRWLQQGLCQGLPLWSPADCLSLWPVETSPSLIFHLSPGLAPLRWALMWDLLSGGNQGFLRLGLDSAHCPQPGRAQRSPSHQS